MILISLNCSGESLEKAIALFHATYSSNSGFYDSYRKIVIFYSENLPKNNKNLVGMSGTFSSIAATKSHAYFDSKELNLFYNKSIVLEKLVTSGLISKRVSERLKVDPTRFDKLLKNIPIKSLFNNYYFSIIERFHHLYPTVDLIELSMKHLLPTHISTLGFDGHSKIYGLQPDGNIGVFNIGDWSTARQINMLDRICRSVSLSPNIYLYIKMIDTYCKNNYEQYAIGYRPMTRYRRKSYDLAIKRLNPNSLIVEPQNLLFSKTLNGLSSRYTVEERANKGILSVFSDFLAK